MTEIAEEIVTSYVSTVVEVQCSVRPSNNNVFALVLSTVVGALIQKVMVNGFVIVLVLECFSITKPSAQLECYRTKFGKMLLPADEK